MELVGLIGRRIEETREYRLRVSFCWGKLFVLLCKKAPFLLCLRRQRAETPRRPSIGAILFSADIFARWERIFNKNPCQFLPSSLSLSPEDPSINFHAAHTDTHAHARHSSKIARKFAGGNRSGLRNRSSISTFPVTVMCGYRYFSLTWAPVRRFTADTFPRVGRRLSVRLFRGTAEFTKCVGANLHALSAFPEAARRASAGVIGARR